MKKMLVILLVIGSCITSFYVGYQVDRDPTLNYRNAKASADNMVFALKHNNELNNFVLVNYLTTHLETSLLVIIHQYTENPDQLSDYDKNEIKKLVTAIDLLVETKKLKFLSNPHLSDEFKSYLVNGIKKIKQDV